jgi:hypothetical protein
MMLQRCKTPTDNTTLLVMMVIVGSICYSGGDDALAPPPSLSSILGRVPRVTIFSGKCPIVKILPGFFFYVPYFGLFLPDF